MWPTRQTAEEGEKKPRWAFYSVLIIFLIWSEPCVSFITAETTKEELHEHFPDHGGWFSSVAHQLQRPRCSRQAGNTCGDFSFNPFLHSLMNLSFHWVFSGRKLSGAGPLYAGLFASCVIPHFPPFVSSILWRFLLTFTAAVTSTLSGFVWVKIKKAGNFYCSAFLNVSYTFSFLQWEAEMPKADSWSWQLNQQNSVSAKITMKHFYHHLLLLQVYMWLFNVNTQQMFGCEMLPSCGKTQKHT